MLPDLRKIADGLERDRREPDKVLAYVQQLRRAAHDMHKHVGEMQHEIDYLVTGEE